MQTFIHTPTNKIENSLEFYKKLNFELISEQALTLVTDGTVVIEINPDRYARAGVKLHKANWGNEVKKLEKLTAVTKTETGYFLSDTNGVWIYLIEGESEFNFDMSSVQASVLGNNMGLSLETTNFDKSSQIWQTVGFIKTEEQGWVVFKNEDGLIISLMQPNNCPHLFFNPSLTFFNGKNNPTIIQKIRDLGILITEGITHFNKEGIVDNIIIRDPGGYGFFLFND